MKKMIALALVLGMTGGAAFAQASFGKAPEKSTSKKDDKTSATSTTISQQSTASGGNSTSKPVRQTAGSSKSTMKQQ